jgi:hypothetical protein
MAVVIVILQINVAKNHLMKAVSNTIKDDKIGVI